MSRTWIFPAGSVRMFTDLLPLQKTFLSKRSLQIKYILITLSVVLAGSAQAGTAFGQSLADLAREARERKASEELSAKVYTNDDLDAATPSAPQAPSPPAAATPALAGRAMALGSRSDEVLVAFATDHESTEHRQA